MPLKLIARVTAMSVRDSMFAGDPDCRGDAPIGYQMTPEAGHLGPRSADSLPRLRWPLIPNVLLCLPGANRG